ncbi:MAG: NAD-dependent deacetylase [Promethearchaeota archaeon]
MNPTNQAVDIIRSTHYMVALTGAGISKESNVPTFRGKDGLWKQYNAMELATSNAFKQNPQLVWDWYSWRQNLIAQCTPNPAHETLAAWEKTGLLKALITQNVDGLHRHAGSTNVLEVHGNLWAVKCTQCSYQSRLTTPASGVPTCPDCSANLRPNVVWFGESLPQRVMDQVIVELNKADTIFVIGTSALIQPAASFPLIVKRHNGKILEINVEDTPLTPLVDVHLAGKAGELLPQLNQLL